MGRGRGDDDGEDVDTTDWEIDAILGVKKNMRKKDVEFFVQWKGKPAKYNSWEMRDSDKMSDDMIEPFNEAVEYLLMKHKKPVDSDEDYEDKELGKDEYVVEDILGVYFNADFDRIEYFIKWESWDPQFNNWEPEENLDCPDFTQKFKEAANYLKREYQRGLQTKSRGRSKSKRSKRDSDDDDDDDDHYSKKKAGPKSKTKRPGPASAKRPGPKSRTLKEVSDYKTSKSRIKIDESDEEDSTPKRPGPKSRTATASRPGPASSKKPGPASLTRPGPKSRTKDSDSDADSGSRKNGKKSADSENDDSDDAGKKRPGPKSKTASRPGPASKTGKKPGPRSKTVAADSDDSD